MPRRLGRSHRRAALRCLARGLIGTSHLPARRALSRAWTRAGAWTRAWTRAGTWAGAAVRTRARGRRGTGGLCEGLGSRTERLSRLGQGLSARLLGGSGRAGRRLTPRSARLGTRTRAWLGPGTGSRLSALAGGRLAGGLAELAGGLGRLLLGLPEQAGGLAGLLGSLWAEAEVLGMLLELLGGLGQLAGLCGDCRLLGCRLT